LGGCLFSGVENSRYPDSIEGDHIIQTMAWFSSMREYTTNSLPAKHGEVQLANFSKIEEATGVGFRKGDMKVYEVFTDVNGKQIEYHYHILRDGQIAKTKLIFHGTTRP